MGPYIGMSSYFSPAIVRSAPSQNIFAEKLGSFGFDPFVMLVVDLMHKFELGVWKAIFTHLLRILYAIAPGGSLVTELNRRLLYNSSGHEHTSD